MLVVAQYFPPDLGGSATRAYNAAKGLTLNGCNVTVITAFPNYPTGNIPKQYRWKPLKAEWMGKIKVIRTFMPPVKSKGIFRRIVLLGSFSISALFALPWIGKTDAIWAETWVPSMIAGKLKRVPVALNVDDLTLGDLPSLNLIRKDSVILKIAVWVYRFFYVKGDAITPISPGYVETISKKYCVDRNKIHVVEVGVDLDVFRNPIVNLAKSEHFEVLYAGVLGVGYDFEQIFAAARVLDEKGVDVEFVLHGIGECLESIRSRIKELNLTNVKLSDKFFSSRKEVANLLNEADALILPMKDYGRPYLGIPSKLYEYQAAGKPIICCAQGEPVKYIKNSKSGVIVEPGNSEALVKAILLLCQDKKTARALGEAGREFVEENSGIEKIGLKLIVVLNGIMSSYQRR